MAPKTNSVISIGGVALISAIVTFSLTYIFNNFNYNYSIENPNTVHSENPSLHKTNDYSSLCAKVQPYLFKDIKKAKIAIREWHRLLPRYYYVQSHKQNITSTSEVELPINHERFNILGPVHSLCMFPLESYGSGDDEKRICGLKQLIELQKEQDKDYECVIYSIGSKNQWGFEESIFARTSCKVETFDCTVADYVQPPAAIRSRVRLHKVCLSNTNNGKYQTWEDLHKLTGVKHPPAYLKMDIEGFEFPVMQSIIDSGELLPLQIAMEIHAVRKEPPLIRYASDRRVSSGELAAFMDYMHIFGGYYLVDRNDNLLCPHCSEILLAKLDCANHPSGTKDSAYSELKKQTHTLMASKIKEVLDIEYYTEIKIA